MAMGIASDRLDRVVISKVSWAIAHSPLMQATVILSGMFAFCPLGLRLSLTLFPEYAYPFLDGSCGTVRLNLS